jgi:hypothetical protein
LAQIAESGIKSTWCTGDKNYVTHTRKSDKTWFQIYQHLKKIISETMSLCQVKDEYFIDNKVRGGQCGITNIDIGYQKLMTLHILG